MNCSKLWNREVVETICGLSFLNGVYKKHREDLLFEKEKALFPMTQPLVIQALRHERMMKLSKDLDLHVRRFKINTHHPKYSLFMAMYQQVNNVMYSRAYGAKAPEPKKIPTRKCPCSECKGFLDKKWVCQICTTQICKRCNEPRDSNHTCDPGAVETMKLLQEDTKGCPSCGCMISKISGCSQMWCTECHTTFDWNTLSVETGVVHNPHYFEFMRKNGTLGRQPGDVRCVPDEGIPHIYDLMNAIKYNVYEAEILETVRLVQEFRANSLLRIPDPLPHHTTLEDLRVRYMLNRIPEDKYRHLLQKNEKYHEKITELTQVRDMYVNVFGDLIRDFMRNKDIDAFRAGHTNLKEYTRDAFKKVSQRYGCVLIKVA
jgi:hypothetical protein